MKYSNCSIPEIVLCEPTINKDNRGLVYESFKKDELNDFLSYDIDFCQDNTLISSYGVIRGLHTNTLNHAQTKLVSVLDGEIIDVAIDFRVGSPIFGKSVCVKLSSLNNKQLLIPRGFLHGFSVLSSRATVLIKIDKYFAAGEGIGIQYNDEELDINWGIEESDVILSQSDENLPKFSSSLSPFTYEKNYY